MHKFLIKVLKHKKLLFFTFLFFVLIGFTVPCVAHGQGASGASWWEYLIPGWSQYVTLKDIFGSVVDDAAKNIANALIIATSGVLVFVTGFLAGTARTLLAGIISLPATVGGTTFGSSYTHITGSDANVAVAAGWPMVRDLANMFVVLGFVIIGISTSLRFREYEAKKLLAPLIIAAILINFSLLICGIFIDGSNIVIRSFLVTGNSFGQTFMSSISNEGTALTNAFGSNAADPISFMGIAAGFLFYNILAIIIFFLFFFLFLFRYMALWILVILSPLAFVCYVFPFTKKFWDMWWNNFLQWCIIGIPAGFFLWLSDKMLAQAATSLNNVNNIDFTTYLVPGCMLIIGFIFSLQTSAMGAGAAISAFKKSGKATLGAAKELGSRTQTGQRTREALSDAGARIQTWAGFAPEGHPAQQRAAREGAARKQVDALRTSSVQGDKARYEQLVKTGQGAIGAAAIASANEHGDFSRIMGNDINKMNQRASYAQSFGHERSEFEKKNYELAGLNEPKIKKIQDAHPGMSHGDASNMAIQEQLKSNLPQMSTPELGAINPAHIGGKSGYELVRDNFTPRMIDQLKVSPNPSLIAGFKAHSSALQAERDGHVDVSGNITNQGEFNKLNEKLKAIDRLP